jgi:hypothetical protein
MRRLALLLAATGFALLLVVGCQSDGPAGPAVVPPVNTHIVDVVFNAVGGNNQTGAVGRELPAALVAKLTDMNGNPIVGYAVNWVILEGGGAVSSVTTETDEHGETMNSWTLGPEPGTNAVEVRSMNPLIGQELTHGTFIASGVASAQN